LKKADLKGDLDPWLLAQRNLLEALESVNNAAEKMPADKSDRERSAKRNFENVCEVALWVQEEVEDVPQLGERLLEPPPEPKRGVRVGGP